MVIEIMKPDLYSTLGVERNATTAEIKKAHRQASKRSHPDVSSGAATEEFLAIQLAYEVLRDSGRRERYDRTGQTSRFKFSLEAELANLFLGLIDSGLDERMDLLAMAKESTRMTLEDLEKQKAKAIKAAKSYRAVARRLRFKKNKLIHEALEAKALITDAIVAEIPDRIKIGQSLLKLLGEMEYEADKLKKEDFVSELLKKLIN